MYKELWNDNWMFSKVDFEEKENLEIPKDWETITLPHDWLIYDTNHLYQNSVGWYQKMVKYTPNGKKWMIRFEGVYMDSTVFLNGKEIATWKYGYSTFDVDLTPFLLEGENILMVRVIHHAPNSRWYSGAGIYRNVWMIQIPSTHFMLDGIYITPVKKDEEWTVEVDTEIQYGNELVQKIAYQLVNPSNEVLLENEFAYEMNQNSFSFQVNNPRLWDIGEGNLYQLTLQLIGEHGVIEEVKEKFGFKTIAFDANKGFFINGRHEKIKGVCEHHGFGCLGAIANRSALRRKLEILQKMGVNAVRTSHNMPSVEFMELADEMGFLVDSEAFDMWGNPKTTYDYARFFKEWAKKDVASWIRRDRNHPSVIMWSVGNEIYDMHEGENGYRELQMLTEEVKKHDYKKHAAITFASNYMRWENAQKCAELVDLVGYNYGEFLYDEHHTKNPDWIIYGSETASMLASRGVYHFPLSRDILCEDDEQCSALGNSFAGWGAHDYLDNIVAERDREFSLGQFIWTGFDYFGEPTPYQTKNSYFGQIDTAGFPKDSYYIYQAEWTDCKKNPMIHIFPYWDFNEGQLIDVRVCSNASCIELFLNGVSLGRREINHKVGKDMVQNWQIPYEKGELLAYAYDEDGKVIATDSRHSFEEACKLLITPYRNESTYEEDKKQDDELIFLEISAVDQNGFPVENANNRILVEVEGSARLLGLDNGDSTDFDQVKGNQKRLFQGKLLAVIAIDKTGDNYGKVVVASNGLESAKYRFGNQESKEEIKEETKEETKAVSCMEIPIRKINLYCLGSTKLTKEAPKVEVGYELLPQNATYSDIEVKIVNDIGIPVPIADYEIKENKIIITAKGDGEFQLRCLGKNGGSIPNVRSILRFEASGLGPAFLNPYEITSTGISLIRPAGISEGVDHGIRFLGKERTRICFEKMDFGKYGTREFTAEIFKYSVEPISFKIYEEIEGTERDCERDEVSKKQKEGIVLLLEGIFDQKANWMEFKKQTYRLNQKLTGFRKIWIESESDFQLRTFLFEPILHGLEKIEANSCDEIFGDSFERNGTQIENIGNNTTVTFRNLNFGEKNVRSIKVCGRTRLAKTTIHLKIESQGIGKKEILQDESFDEKILENQPIDKFSRTDMLEVHYSEEYLEYEFPVEALSGTVQISFIFLPGSQFDFAWFQFVE